MGIPAAGFSPPPLTVVMPTDAARRELIDRLALFVAAEGHTFECAIMEREQLNPVYRFLFDQQLPDHLYYRWKVISLCCGRHVTPHLTPHIPHIRR